MSDTVNRFEDLIAWQKARSLTAAIYKITNQGTFSKDFGLKEQIRRAGVSVMSNIAEGFERGKMTEFHQFLSIAKGSSGELRSQLYVALDVQHVDADEFQQLSANAQEVGRIIGGLRSSVERKCKRS
jgi:four helix bundle protein